MEIATETCTEAVQSEEFRNPRSQTSDKSTVSAAVGHEEGAPQQPQPHQQTQESFKILTWVKKVAGDHFALKETEAEELAIFMTQLRPGKITKTELHKPIESTGPVTRSQKMRKGNAVSRKTLSKRGTNPKKFVIDVSDDEERTVEKEKKKVRPVSEIREASLTPSMRTALATTAEMRGIARKMWEFQEEEQQEKVAGERSVRAGPRRRLQLRDKTTGEEADTQQENREEEMAEEEDDLETMREHMRLEIKRKGKAQAKPKKRQRLIPSAPKGVAIKEPTQVLFSHQDSSPEQSDGEDYDETEKEKPYFTKEHIHLTEQVMKKVSSFRSLNQRKEFVAREKKKFTSGKEVVYEALDELE